MKNVQAEAIICLYNNSFTERDYYIVGEEIYISKPGPISELDVEDIEVKAECLRVLLRSGAPAFQSWSQFELENGTATVASFRTRGL